MLERPRSKAIQMNEIRIRYPSGKACCTQGIPHNAALSQVLLTIYQYEEEFDEVFDGCVITTSYPRKVFTAEEWDTTTLEQAGVVPSGSLILEYLSPEEIISIKTRKLDPPLLDKSLWTAPVDVSVIPRIERYYPHIETPSDVRDLIHMLENSTKEDAEFAFSISFHPDWIDEVCYSGCFPMAIQLGDGGVFIQAVKMSKKRCVMKPPQLKTPKTVKKISKGFSFSVNQDFEAVLAMCVKIKGENWLCPNLQRTFTYLHKNSDKYRAKFISFEVWDSTTQELVAGELGYMVGSIYTSLSGAYVRSRTGNLQLCATGKFLEQKGICWWDFEMSHPYKLALGASEIPRPDWAQTYKEFRDLPFVDLTLQKTASKTFFQ